MKKKGRIIEEDGNYYPQYYQYFTWWNFNYNNVVGGIDLGLANIAFSSYNTAMKYLEEKGYNILNEKAQKILELENQIRDLKNTLKEKEDSLSELKDE